jgi:phosphoadenosine phosphosulfate reductase
MDEEKKQGIENSYIKGIENIEIIRPLADMTERDVWRCIHENNMPFSSIYNKGFKVIDCKCCTTRIGRKSQDKEHKGSDFDKETLEKLKSLGYM